MSLHFQGVLTPFVETPPLEDEVLGHSPVVPGPLLEEVSDSSINILGHTNAADNGKLYSYLFSLAKTPIKFDKLEQELQNYNREDAEN